MYVNFFQLRTAKGDRRSSEARVDVGLSNDEYKEDEGWKTMTRKGKTIKKNDKKRR